MVSSWLVRYPIDLILYFYTLHQTYNEILIIISDFVGI